MMSSSEPTTPTGQDAAELTAFLPQLRDPTVDPVVEWQMQGALSRPKYAKWVCELFQAAGRDCWAARSYHPTASIEMLDDEDLIRSASIDQIKAMLTYCVRGERFCDGLQEELIRTGKMLALLERIEAVFAAPAGD